MHFFFFFCKFDGGKKGESALVLYSKHVYVEREREREREEEEKEKAYLENDDTALLSSSSLSPSFCCLLSPFERARASSLSSSFFVFVGGGC